MSKIMPIRVRNGKPARDGGQKPSAPAPPRIPIRASGATPAGRAVSGGAGGRSARFERADHRDFGQDVKRVKRPPPEALIIRLELKSTRT